MRLDLPRFLKFMTSATKVVLAIMFVGFFGLFALTSADVMLGLDLGYGLFDVFVCATVLCGIFLAWKTHAYFYAFFLSERGEPGRE